MLRILLVEDQPPLSDMLARRLKKAKFDVLVAANGEEGCKVARSEQPDLILMDMDMPIMDGCEATRRLKGAAETRAIPIIVLTAHAMKADEDKARQAGCDDWQTKPVDWQGLLVKIHKLLPNHKE
jgi:CheY-like chemotaxis protein